jgi:hypothetical protein
MPGSLEATTTSPATPAALDIDHTTVTMPVTRDCSDRRSHDNRRDSSGQQGNVTVTVQQQQPRA